MDPAALHVLIIADSPDTRLAVGQILLRSARDAYTIAGVDHSDHARDACRAAPPNCVLLDYCLPDQDGQAVLAKLRAITAVPVVLLTDVEHEDRAVEALQHGAQDYAIKDTLTPARLRLTIQRAVESAQRQASAALWANEQRFRLALDIAQIIVWEWDIAARTITYSAHATTSFSLPPGQITHSIDKLDAAIYPPDRPAYDQALGVALANGGVYQLQVRVYTPDDQLRWLELR
ncbi:MAG: response regulator, partial [Chloroflexales bacterium]